MSLQIRMGYNVVFMLDLFYLLYCDLSQDKNKIILRIPQKEDKGGYKDIPVLVYKLVDFGKVQLPGCECCITIEFVALPHNHVKEKLYCVVPDNIITSPMEGFCFSTPPPPPEKFQFSFILCF